MAADDNSQGMSSAVGALSDPVAALAGAGDYAGAARLAAAGGDLPRAILLYERIWRFADALPLALALADRPLAIRLALDAGDTATAARIAADIPRSANAEARAAAASFATRGRHWEAARMFEGAGEPALASEYFRRAGNLLDAGRMEELAGRPREAGIAYEQALAATTNPEDAAAVQLALGRLLGRLGRHQDAARALQAAMRSPDSAVRLSAGCALTSELVALGFRMAAAEIVRRLRREWPDLPGSPGEVAELDAAAVSAGTSTLGQVVAAPGLLRQRFKVLSSLGAGATSHVYMAEDTLLGHAVALKLLAVGAGARGPERQAYLRFTREAEAAARLRHPNIVALQDADPAMGLFVLELMSGGTLADRLKEQGILSPVAVRRLALDLLAALSAAHEAGMVHRDVKPANILFDATGNAKLADFGAAHLVDFGQTQTAGLLGTVAYMSPEQISGGAISRAADLYSLGITLFEALTGRLPFLGPDIVAQHLGEEPPRPSACAATTTPAQVMTPTATMTTPNGAGEIRVTEVHDRVLLRALRKAPSERWTSAEQMADAIRAWWPGQPSDAGISLPASAEAPASVLRRPSSGGPNDTNVARAPDLPLGRSRMGSLLRRHDPDLGRPVLVEIRDRPVTDMDLGRLQVLAGAGGPHVQRVLALSDDGRTVTYELAEGPRVSPVDLSPEHAAVFAHARALVDRAYGETPDSPRTVIMSPGGPVLLVVEPVAAPPDAGTDTERPQEPQERDQHSQSRIPARGPESETDPGTVVQSKRGQ